MAWYPDIDAALLTPLRALKQALEADPAYLDRPDCPYGPETRDFLRIFAPKTAENGQKEVVGPSIFESYSDKWTAFEGEAVKLYTLLIDAGNKLAAADHSERMQLLKTRTNLLEKLITLQERAHGLKNLNRFQTLVLDFIQDHVSVDQMNQLRTRLAAEVSVAGPAPVAEEASDA